MQTTTERRVVTVVFADLVGFSTEAEHADAEATRRVLDDYASACRRVIGRYGGRVEKFAGDAVMAVWGYPAVGADAAERAVRAALDLVETVERPLRVGVATGTVAVTVSGDTDGFVAGDVVNVAARLQQIAEVDSVWTDRATFDATRSSIDFAELGQHAVKGRTSPVAVYRAQAVVGERGGRGRVDDVLDVPLVGYRRELSTIKDALHAAIEGDRGRLLIVSGEAGTGKSRLGRELLNYADGLETGIRWHSSRASALDGASPFGALESAVRGRLGIGDHAVDDLGALLDAHLDEFVVDRARRARVRSALGALLGVEHVAIAQEDLFAAWIDWFASLATDDDTVVWLLDDAHLADDLLLGFIELLVGSVGTRVLVVLLARPDLLARRPTIAAVRGSSLLGLEGLGRAPMGELVDALIADAPDELRDELVAGAGGLPLYAVEVVRGMIDRGEIVEVDGRRVLSGVERRPEATATLSGVVMSRLDLLDDRDRRMLQQASVLGVSFTIDQLAALVELPVEQAEDGVARLAAKDLVRTATDTLSSEFGMHRFVQALVQQVAYDSLARSDRARLHLRAATVLSAEGADSGLIVEHLLRARELDDTSPVEADVAEWLVAAAERAERTGAYRLAIRNLELAIEATDDPSRRDDYHLRAADLAIIIYEARLATEHAQAVVADDVQTRILVDIARARALDVGGHVRDALAVLDRWPELPEGTPDLTITRWAWTRGRALMAVGAAHAAEWGERALVLAERIDEPFYVHQALNIIAISAGVRGLMRVNNALHIEGARYAREHGLSQGLAISLNNIALGYSARGDLAASADAYREVVEIGARTGSILSGYPLASLVEVLGGLGRFDEAIQVIEDNQAQLGPITLDTVLGFTEPVHAFATARSSAGLPVDPALLDLVMEAAGDDLELSRDASTAAANLGEALQHPDRVNMWERAVRLEFEAGGLADGMTATLPHALDGILLAGDFAAARRMLASIPEIGDQRDLAMLAVHLRRVRATLEALDPESGVSRGDVEVALRASLEELEAMGRVPDQARTLVALAHVLASVGRSTGANAARAEATRLLEECHAWGLVERLGLSRVEATDASA